MRANLGRAIENRPAPVIRLPKPTAGPRWKAPAHLAPQTKRWFARVARAFVLEEHNARLLVVACESWDRAEAARQVIAERGMTYDDRHGAPHPRPEVRIEHAARIAFMRALRELALDISAPDSSMPIRESRPPC